MGKFVIKLSYLGFDACAEEQGSPIGYLGVDARCDEELIMGYEGERLAGVIVGDLLESFGASRREHNPQS